MTRGQRVLVASLALALTGIGTVLAQTSTTGLDIEAIDRRAQDEAAALSALVSRAIARQAGASDANAEAQRTVDLAKAKLGEAAARIKPAPISPGALDLDAMMANAGKTMAPPPPSAPQFLAFASLAMPDDSLRQMIGDVSRAGGTIVFRGFSPQGPGAFMKGLTKAIPPDTQPRISIDPRLFKAFHVEAVPTYIAVAAGMVPCAGDDCGTNPPPFDRVSGNVTTAFAAETIADGNGPGASVARAALQSLKVAP